VCLLAICYGLVGCGGSPGGRSYSEAAAATAVAVAATGVHRAITKDCWARCSPGYACNRESGLCQPSECTPECVAGYTCTVTPTGNTCQADAQPMLNPFQGGVAVPRSGAGAAGGIVQTNGSAGSMAPTAPQLNPSRSNLGQVQIQRGNPGSPDPSATTNTGSIMFPKPDSPDQTKEPVAVIPPSAAAPCPQPPAPKQSGKPEAKEPGSGEQAAPPPDAHSN
jgi:hypothetical protein